MIELTSGSTRIGNRVLRPSDGPFSAGPDAERRLVSAGVARYVFPADELTARVVREEETGHAGTSVEKPPPAEDKPHTVEGVAKSALDEAEGVAGIGEDADSGQPREIPKDNGLYDADHLNVLTNGHLKEIAENMGLDTSAMRKKADYVEAILAAQDSGAEEDDGETPPELGAEEPVS